MPKKNGKPNAREVDALLKYERLPIMQDMRHRDVLHDEKIGHPVDRALKQRMIGIAKKIEKMRPPTGYASFDELCMAANGRTVDEVLADLKKPHPWSQRDNQRTGDNK